MSLRILTLGGLSAAPIAWALNTQLGQVLSHSDCVNGSAATATSALVLLLVTIAGLVPALRDHSAQSSRSARFIITLGLLTGSAFAFALLLQGAAALLLSPCLR